MADRDVEVVGIIVRDRLPVKRPRAEGDAAHHPKILQAVGRDLVLVRSHHLRDGRRTGLQGHEQEPAPGLERDREQPMVLDLEARIFLPMWNADQLPVPSVAPCMVRAGQHFGAAARAVDQP